MHCPPLPQVLAQEMSRYNRLLGVLRSSLQQLGRAVAGLQLLSAELEEVLAALGAGGVCVWGGERSGLSLEPGGHAMSRPKQEGRRACMHPAAES